MSLHLQPQSARGEDCAKHPRRGIHPRMKLSPVMAVALVALLSACTSPPSSLSVAQLEGSRSAQQLQSAESYQRRMSEIRSAHSVWGPQDYPTLREEIDSDQAVLLNSVYSD